MLFIQDYGKEGQAHDVIMQYFKSKRGIDRARILSKKEKKLEQWVGNAEFARQHEE